MVLLKVHECSSHAFSLSSQGFFYKYKTKEMHSVSMLMENVKTVQKFCGEHMSVFSEKGRKSLSI